MLYTKKRISDLWFLSAMSNKKQRARAEKERANYFANLPLRRLQRELIGVYRDCSSMLSVPIEFGDLGYQPFFYNPPRILAL